MHNRAVTAHCVVMELAVDPSDLYAAAVALASCGRTLEAAGLDFAGRAQSDLPGVGSQVAVAAGRGARLAEHHVQSVSDDIEQLARALAALAHHYDQVDGTAVRRGPASQ